MVELIVRLVFSLAVVLGLLLLCARLAGRRFQGRRDAMVQVMHRQPISRNASVSVVSVGGRVLVLGTTDQEVRLLTELDPTAVVDEAADDEPATDETTDANELPRPPLAVVTHIDAAESVRAQRLELSAADLLLQEQLRQQVGQQVSQERAPDPESRYEFRPGRHLAARSRQPARTQPARTRPARPQPARTEPARARATEQQGALSGSLLSVRTWRQAWGAVTGHAS